MRSVLRLGYHSLAILNLFKSGRRFSTKDNVNNARKSLVVLQYYWVVYLDHCDFHSVAFSIFRLASFFSVVS